MLRFRGKDVLRISKYNMLMFIILGLLGLGISVGYLCRHVPRFQGIGTFHLLYDFRDVVHIWYYHRSQPIFAE
mgnify:FL=1